MAPRSATHHLHLPSPTSWFIFNRLPFMPFCHIPDIICLSNVHCFLTAKGREHKIREASYLPFPGGVQSKNKVGFDFPPSSCNSWRRGRTILGMEGITLVWQVEAPKYPRKKFRCLARGAQSPRCWSPGVGIRAAPGKTPKTSGSSGVQHRRLDWKRKSRFPRKRAKS